MTALKIRGVSCRQNLISSRILPNICSLIWQDAECLFQCSTELFLSKAWLFDRWQLLKCLHRVLCMNVSSLRHFNFTLIAAQSFLKQLYWFQKEKEIMIPISLTQSPWHFHWLQVEPCAASLSTYYTGQRIPSAILWRANIVLVHLSCWAT